MLYLLVSILLLAGAVLDSLLNGFSGVHIFSLIIALLCGIAGFIGKGKTAGGITRSKTFKALKLAILLIIIAALYLCSAQFFKSTQVQSEERIARISRMLKAGDYTKAYELLQEWEKAKGESFLTENLYGEFYLAQGRYSEAEKAFRAALKNRADNVTARLGLMNSLAAQNNLKEAVPEAKNLLKINPHMAEAYQLCGDYYLETGDTLRAAYYYTQAKRESAADITPGLKLAGVHIQTHSFAQAAAEIETVLRISNTTEGTMQVMNAIEKLRSASEKTGETAGFGLLIDLFPDASGMTLNELTQEMSYALELLQQGRYYSPGRLHEVEQAMIRRIAGNLLALRDEISSSLELNGMMEDEKKLLEMETAVIKKILGDCLAYLRLKAEDPYAPAIPELLNRIGRSTNQFFQVVQRPNISKLSLLNASEALVNYSSPNAVESGNVYALLMNHSLGSAADYSQGIRAKEEFLTAWNIVSSESFGDISAEELDALSGGGSIEKQMQISYRVRKRGMITGQSLENAAILCRNRELYQLYAQKAADAASLLLKRLPEIEAAADKDVKSMLAEKTNQLKVAVTQYSASIQQNLNIENQLELLRELAFIESPQALSTEGSVIYGSPGRVLLSQNASIGEYAGLMTGSMTDAIHLIRNNSFALLSGTILGSYGSNPLSCLPDGFLDSISNNLESKNSLYPGSMNSPIGGVHASSERTLGDIAADFANSSSAANPTGVQDAQNGATQFNQSLGDISQSLTNLAEGVDRAAGLMNDIADLLNDADGETGGFGTAGSDTTGSDGNGNVGTGSNESGEGDSSLADIAAQFNNLAGNSDSGAFESGSGGMIQDGANAFSDQMADDLMPALNNLTEALDNAARSTEEIAGILDQAEDDASQAFGSESGDNSTEAGGQGETGDNTEGNVEGENDDLEDAFGSTDPSVVDNALGDVCENDSGTTAEDIFHDGNEDGSQGIGDIAGGILGGGDGSNEGNTVDASGDSSDDSETSANSGSDAAGNGWVDGADGSLKGSCDGGINNAGAVPPALPHPNDLKISVRKPNIYIYPCETQQVRVICEDPSSITKSIPAYDADKGWEVTASSSGRLNGEYDFLFYEAFVNKAFFQQSTGWFVPAEERAEALGKMLEAYRFNEKEKKDFIEFWNNRLDRGKTYIAYPQETICLDEAFPIQFEPEPQSVFRIWFWFVEAGGNERVSEPVSVEKIERCGFTVVEWGGMGP